MLPPARRSATDAVTLQTADGIRLSGVHRPRDSDLGVVIAHGLTNATHKPSTQAVIDAFAGHVGVVAVDFRGHGRSGGRSTVGRDETFDLDAAIRFGRDFGYATLATVGFSMGASVALRQAAGGAEPPDAVVSVSAPSRWYIRDTTPMRRVHWMLESRVGGVAGRAMGIRLGDPWTTVPESPLEVVGRIAVPLLLVHGTADSYFPVSHAELLHRNAPGSALWVEPGMGHAESATSDALVARIVDWLAAAVAPGRAAVERAAVERIDPTGPADGAAPGTIGA